MAFDDIFVFEHYPLKFTLEIQTDFMHIGISEAQAYKFSGCSRIASLQDINRLIPYGAPIYVRDDKIVSDMPKDVNRYLKCALRPCQVTEVTREFTSTLDIRLLKCTRCPVPLVTFTDARFLYYKLKVQSKSLRLVATYRSSFQQIYQKFIITANIWLKFKV